MVNIMTDIEEKAKQLTDVKTIFLSSILTALALVVGLFWNDAIRAAIEQVVPKGESLIYKFLAAIIVTIIVVIISYILVRGHKIAEKRLRELIEIKKKKGFFKF